MTDKTAPPTYDTTRRYRRLSTNVNVRVFHTGGHTAGSGHDLGVGGMAIYVPLELAVGTSVNLSFHLPHSQMVFGVRALVRNSNGFRYGVEFVDLKAAEVEEFRRVATILELTDQP